MNARPHLVPVAELDSGDAVLMHAIAVVRRQQLRDAKPAEDAAPRLIAPIAMPPPSPAPQPRKKIAVHPVSKREAYSTHTRPYDVIIQWVADRHGFSYGELIGDSRSAKIVAARHLAIQLVQHSKRYRMMIRQDLGAIFGGKDHATINHILKKAKSTAVFIDVGRDKNIRPATIADGISMRLRSECPWQDVENAFGKSAVCFSYRAMRIKENKIGRFEREVIQILGQSQQELAESLKYIDFKVRSDASFAVAAKRSAESANG